MQQSQQDGGFENYLRPIALTITGLLFLVFVREVATRYIGNDDYTTLYLAWQKSTGLVLGEKLHSAYFLQANLFVPLFWIFEDSLWPLYIGRIMTLALILGTCFYSYKLASRIVGASAGLVVPMFILTGDSMFHHGLDLRPDPLGTFLWVLVFFYILHHGRNFRRHHFFFLGMMTGLCFFNREKAVLFGPIAYTILLWFFCLTHAEKTWPARILAFLREYLFSVLGFFLVAGLYMGLIALTDDLETYLSVTYTHFTGLAHYAKVEGIRWKTLSEAFQREPVFWAFFVLGTLLRAAAWKRFNFHENVVAGGLLLLAALSVAANPTYYVYNLMTLQALLAPFCAYPFGWLMQHLRQKGFSAKFKRLAFIGGLALVVIAPQINTLWYFAVKDTLAHQRRLHQFIFDNLAPEEAVFALDGVGLYRPSVTNWRLTKIMVDRHYQQGRFRYSDELRATKPTLVIASYRGKWLTDDDQAFVEDYYVLVVPHIWVPGFNAKSWGAEVEFELLLAGRYVLEVKPGVTASVDGQSWQPGKVRLMEAGRHVLVSDGKVRLRRYFPPEAMDLLANPRLYPYLIRPDLKRF